MMSVQAVRIAEFPIYCWNSEDSVCYVELGEVLIDVRGTVLRSCKGVTTDLGSHGDCRDGGGQW